MSSARANAGWPAVSECFRALCVGVDSARSLKAALLLKYGELEQLVRMKIHPSEYLDAHSFAGDYAVVSFLKKNPDMPVSCDRAGAAFAAFTDSEEFCKRTNERISAYLSGDLKIDQDVNEVIHLASRKISRLLSVSPNLTEGGYSWGPGATLDLSRAEAYPDTKLVDLPFTVTGSAWKHAARLIDSDLHWKDAIIKANADYTGPIFTIVPGGRYDTVPKTVLIDRSILVEPRLNTILQKKMGSQLRALLGRVGIDLEDQSRNQALAGLARALDLATLDLEAASDSISRKAVELLLPPAWFDILDDLRSKWVQRKDGSFARLEKFSSMGNGFTFELETLIFWALSSAANELSFWGITGVYGDDIIVHRDTVPLLTRVFDFMGFKLNREKSFTEGEFFESCGEHYFGDCNVTPAYQKCSPTTGDEAARMGNRILRLAARLGTHSSLDKRFVGAWKSWFRHWNVDPQQCGPFIGEGDGYWETEFSHYATRTRYGPFGPWCRVRCYSDVGREIPANDGAMLALWLMQDRSDAPSRGYSPRIGVGFRQALKSLHDLEDSTVSITGSAGKIRKSSSLAEIGMLASRVKPRVVSRHRSIPYGLRSTVLSW